MKHAPVGHYMASCTRDNIAVEIPLFPGGRSILYPASDIYDRGLRRRFARLADGVRRGMRGA